MLDQGDRTVPDHQASPDELAQGLFQKVGPATLVEKTGEQLAQDLFGKINPTTSVDQVSDEQPQTTTHLEAGDSNEDDERDNALLEQLVELSGLEPQQITEVVEEMPQDVILEHDGNSPTLTTSDGRKFRLSESTIMFALLFADLMSGAKGLSLIATEMSGELTKNILLKIGINPELLENMSEKYGSRFASELLYRGDPKQIEAFMKGLVERNDVKSLGRYLGQLSDEIRHHFLGLKNSERYNHVAPLDEKVYDGIRNLLENTEFRDLVIIKSEQTEQTPST